jgi:spore maturation protein CgeB
MTLDIVIFGLSITSSWGNGHATTYRALAKALAERGHRITFLERDMPWYREHRDLRKAPFCRVELYRDLKDVPRRFYDLICDADLVIIGSFVPNGSILADWITSNARGITAFYDIDTPVTLSQLEGGQIDYINASLIPRFDLYLSFTGGPTLDLIESLYGSPRARPLYCAVDPAVHAPVDMPPTWHLGYLGTYSEDRQRSLERLLIEPARSMPDERFVVGGAQYPDIIQWPANVERVEHLPPREHAGFYCGQRYTLNLTRADMAAAGFSPSVRLFEAASCGVPIITDPWPGLDTFFEPGKEILVASDPDRVVEFVKELPDEARRTIAAAARSRVLRNHTAEHRAKELEDYYREAKSEVGPRQRADAVA